MFVGTETGPSQTKLVKIRLFQRELLISRILGKACFDMRIAFYLVICIFEWSREERNIPFPASIPSPPLSIWDRSKWEEALAAVAGGWC